MTKEELDAQAAQLAESQEKFVATLYMMFDVIGGLKEYLKSVGDRLDAHGAHMDAQRALIDAHGAQFKANLDAFQALIAAFTDSNLSVKENSEKLDKFIGKMESYFGSGAGLEYDN
jgi:hypothetical protein